MTFEKDYFIKRKADKKRLLEFGFTEEETSLIYQQDLMEGIFEVRLRVDEKGEVSGQIIDKDLGEPYEIFRSSQAVGTFVGQVRDAYSNLLQQIATSCFTAQPFSKGQTNRLVSRIADEWGDVYDHPFERYPDYVSYRVGGKWYALIFPLAKGKLADFDGEMAEQQTEVINLKVGPDKLSDLLKKDGIYPSYHMNKKSWVSVVLDDSLSDEELWGLVSKSRQLVALINDRLSGQPQYWIIPANLNYYDIDAEFAASKEILWTQKARIKKGDYVGIYMTAPIKSLRYLCYVLDADITNDAYSDKNGSKNRMRLKLLKTLDDELLSRDCLKENGVTNIRGPRRMTDALIEKVKTLLSDDC
ncbi:MmcQ/YjbR family DNA-binding protein [Streptococcus dentiloxodontae]